MHISLEGDIVSFILIVVDGGLPPTGAAEDSGGGICHPSSTHLNISIRTSTRPLVT